MWNFEFKLEYLYYAFSLHILSTLLTTYTYTNRFLFWRQSDIGPKSEMRKLTFELFKFWRLACSSSLSIFLCELGNFWTIKRFTWSPSPHCHSDQNSSADGKSAAAVVGTEIAVEDCQGAHQLENKDNDKAQIRKVLCWSWFPWKYVCTLHSMHCKYNVLIIESAILSHLKIHIYIYVTFKLIPATIKMSSNSSELVLPHFI